MTVAAKPATISYIEDGISVAFAVPFRFKAASDLVVERLSDGVVATLQLGTDYSVTGGMTDAGGTLTRTVATNGAILWITRDTARAQPMTYATGDRFPAASHEEALDRQMLIAQEQDARQDDLTTRALLVPAGEAIGDIVVAPDSVLAFDGQRRPVAKPIGSFPPGPSGAANSTFVSLTDMKKAPLDNRSYILADGVKPPYTYAYVEGNFAGLADDDYIVASNQIPVATGALVRPEDCINVTKFMAVNGVASARLRLDTYDATAAFNLAFEVARATGRNVFVPDGQYLVGNLIFGTQNQTGQSSSPLGLIGQSKTGTVLKAKPGLTGTLLKSQSVAGVTFRDFSINTMGSTAQAWDCSWKPGPGPSTQCVIRDIIVTVHNDFPNGPAHVDWGDLNDTYPNGVTVRPGGQTDYSNCYISMVQSGGLTALNGCIWTGGYMNFGCQNGEFNHCWGHGIQFAVGCLNHVKMQAGYMYANPLRSAIFWSESQAQNSGMKAFVLIGTELNTEMGGIASYFDINLFSMLHLIGCEFIGTAPALFGAVARGDGIGPALCLIQGGTYYPQMVVADVTNGSGIEVEAMGFRNAGTSRMLTKNRARNFTPIIKAQGQPAGTYTVAGSTFGRAHRDGNSVRFKLRLGWTGHTSSGVAQISGLPWEIQAGGVDGVTAELISLGSSSAGARASIADGMIIFYDSSNNPIALPANGEVILAGHYSVEA